MNRVCWVAAAFMTLVLVGCGDDDGLSPQDAAVDGGGMDVAQVLDGPPADGPNGDAAIGDGSVEDASTDDGGATKGCLGSKNLTNDATGLATPAPGFPYGWIPGP